MTIEVSDKFWKWLALALLVLFACYIVVWPRLEAGIQAATYINACVQAKICPSAEQLQTQLASLNAAAKPAVPAASPSPTPSPSSAPKGK